MNAGAAPSGPDNLTRRAADASPGPPRREAAAAPDTGPDPDEAKDRALVIASREGDRGALADLLTRYQDRLHAICYRMCGDHDAARDLTQEALVKIIQGLHQFNGRSKLSTWMIRVTINVCLTDRRRRRLRRTVALSPSSVDVFGRGSSGSAAPPHDAGAPAGCGAEREEPGSIMRVQQAEEREMLYAAMARLDEPQRAIIILRDVHDLDYRQIADILELAGGTVKSRLFRARQGLRDQIERLRAERAGRKGSTPPGG